MRVDPEQGCESQNGSMCRRTKLSWCGFRIRDRMERASPTEKGFRGHVEEVTPKATGSRQLF